MWGFLSRLFDTSGFPARWHCGTWSSGHGWLHILSDLGIWGAYLAIPCVLAYFASRKPDLPFRRIFWLFGAFILACGTTHLMEAVIFWWPAYRLAGVIKLLTALVSWATVLALIPATPRALALRTPQEFDRELNERRRAERELREMQAELERRVAGRTAELTAANEALQSEIIVRERFEEALASAREWFEVTLASIGDAVIVTDTEGRVTFLNQVARELTGRFDDVRGNPLERIFCTVGDEAGSPAEDPAARVLGTGSTGTLTHRRLLMAADGTHRPIEDSVAPIRNAQGEVLGVVLVFRDVTERRRSEQAVRRSEERYRALVQATSQIVWTTDPNGQVVEDSPSWRTFTGQSYDQWKGAGWLNVVHPDDRARAADVWRRSVLSKSNYQVEYRLRSAAGEYRHMEARGVPVLDAEGKIVEWIGMNVDVTQQRQSAAALRDADRRKDQFLAMLGHELRNPLSGIAGAIQVLASIDSPNADAAEMRRIIERQTAHMSRLIDDLLEVSRISRGKIQLRPERVDLSELVRHTTDDLRPIFEAGRLDLNLELPEEPVFVSGDPTRLAQVLVNLLQNAAKFTNPGGHVGVTLSVDRARQSADVRVRDSGIGMTPETLAQIFEPFSQADISLERSRGGLGLGLALVQGLVELHGGQVTAASEGVGRGAEFHVRMPLVTEGPISASKPAPTAASAPRPRRILIIDDQRAASLPLRKLLELDGHCVETAGDGPTGIDIARRFHPQAVLCDIGLPGGMSGYAVAEALRADPVTRSAFLVAITGYGRDEDRHAAAAAGFDRHLTKPVSQDELRELLRELPDSAPPASDGQAFSRIQSTHS